MNVVCVLPLPRYGDNQCTATIYNALGGRKILLAFGAWWTVAMELRFEQAIEADWILCMDADSGFFPKQIDRLEQTAREHPDLDAIAALQMHRSKDEALFSGADKNGDEHGPVEVDTAHLGLTLLKCSVLRAMPRPWFRHPKEFHDDVGFWRNWREFGAKIHVEPRCSIAHFEVGARRFDSKWKPKFDRVTTWVKETQNV